MSTPEEVEEKQHGEDNDEQPIPSRHLTLTQRCNNVNLFFVGNSKVENTK